MEVGWTLLTMLNQDWEKWLCKAPKENLEEIKLELKSWSLELFYSIGLYFKRSGKRFDLAVVFIFYLVSQVIWIHFSWVHVLGLTQTPSSLNQHVSHSFIDFNLVQSQWIMVEPICSIMKTSFYILLFGRKLARFMPNFVLCISFICAVMVRPSSSFGPNQTWNEYCFL